MCIKEIRRTIRKLIGLEYYGMFYLRKMRMCGQHRHIGILEHSHEIRSRRRMGRKPSPLQVETSLFGVLQN